LHGVFATVVAWQCQQRCALAEHATLLCTVLKGKRCNRPKKQKRTKKRKTKKKTITLASTGKHFTPMKYRSLRCTSNLKIRQKDKNKRNQQTGKREKQGRRRFGSAAASEYRVRQPPIAHEDDSFVAKPSTWVAVAAKKLAEELQVRCTVYARCVAPTVVHKLAKVHVVLQVGVNHLERPFGSSGVGPLTLDHGRLYST
jgi:hypothetical protein